MNVRHARAALSHDEAFALRQAALGYASLLDVADGHHPDPELRAMATTLRDLAGGLAIVNSGRPES